MADAHRTVRLDGSGEVHSQPSSTEQITADSLDEARMLVLARVAAYAEDNHRRAVRLRVREPDGEWLLGVNPDGTGFELDRRHPASSDADASASMPDACAEPEPAVRLSGV